MPLLSREEKRRILAQIVRLNPLDCFDDSGAFDIARAKKVLPACSVRHIVVHETTRTDPEGNPVTQRKIHLRLVDPLSAMRLDDQLERRRESLPAPADSDALSEEEEAEREAGAARAREYIKEKLQESQENGTPFHFAYLFDPEEPWITATPTTPDTTAPPPAIQPAPIPTPLPESKVPQPTEPQASASRPHNSPRESSKHDSNSNTADHATPQESGRGIPAPFKEDRQPKGKVTPSSSPPFPPPVLRSATKNGPVLRSETKDGLSPVQITPAKSSPPIPAARPPPPPHPMSFTTQGRARLVE